MVRCPFWENAWSQFDQLHSNFFILSHVGEDSGFWGFGWYSWGEVGDVRTEEDDVGSWMGG